MSRAPAWPAARSLPIAVAVLLLAACGSEPKRFYGEDGPPDHVPRDLLATPDAVPRDEPLNPYANRPYVALGRTYVPDTSRAPFRQRGMASWYGRQFQGNRTASGEPYDMFGMTAAHPTLPIPSYVRVTNTHDGRSVVVRINDRGPFLRDRIIDLSYVAAARLGLAGPGSGEVEVERIVGSQMARAAPPPAVAPAAAPAAAGPAPAAALAAAAPSPTASVSAAAETSTAVALAVAPPGSDSMPRVLPAREAAPPGKESGLPAVAPPGQESGPSAVAPLGAKAGAHWSVQLGAFAIATNAEALRDRLALLLSSPEASALPPELRSPRIERGAGLSRVLIGDAGERAVAQRWSRLLERYLSRPTALFVR